MDRLLRDPEVKVAVWAHNGHVMTGHHGGGPVPAMGRHLRQRHGDAYYALGLLMGEGEFRARRSRFGRPDPRKPPVRNRVPRADDATMVEARLAAACPYDHLLDLRGGERPDGVARWLGARLYVRGFGAVVNRFTYKLTFTPTVLARRLRRPGLHPLGHLLDRPAGGKPLIPGFALSGPSCEAVHVPNTRRSSWRKHRSRKSTKLPRTR